MLNINNIIFIWFILQNFLFFSIYNKYAYFELINYTEKKLSLIPDNKFTYKDFINIIIDNIIYTKISIGEPKQNLIALINSEEYSYFIFKDICTLNSYYNQNISKAFNYNDKEKTFFYNDYSKALYVKETISLNINKKEKIINDFPIMFMNDPLNDELFNKRSSLNITGKTCFTIGLKFMENNGNKNAKNFISVLNNENIIDSNLLFIEYDENGKEKNLILGEYPECLDSKKYSIKNEFRTNIKIYNRFKAQWGLEFNKIISGDFSLDKKDVAFHHNLGVIYGTNEYRKFIHKNFFEHYINLNICQKIDNDIYLYYFCNKDKFEKEKINFPEIKMIKIEFGEEFILNYDDLFFTKGNNIYFLIIFHNLYNEIWELGKPFLKKYSFAYNFDSKIIHYYSKKNIYNENINKNDNNKFENNFSSFPYIIIISFFIGIFFFFAGKIYYNKRKNNLLKAKELEENFSYYNNINKTKLIEE